MAKVATTTFLKERKRGFLRDRCILDRSPCELLTSAFARLPSEVGDYSLHIASDARGWGLRMVETIKLASNESSSKPKLRRMSLQSSCIGADGIYTSKCLNCMPLNQVC